jgi:hypothetical protein
MKTQAHITQANGQYSVYIDGTFINIFDTLQEAQEVSIFLQVALDYATGERK